MISPTIVSNRNGEHQSLVPAVTFSTRRSTSRVEAAEIEATDSLDPNPATVNCRVFDQGADLRFDGLKDAGDLGIRSLQIVDRAHPKRHRWDSEINAPREHIVELLCAIA